MGRVPPIQPDGSLLSLVGDLLFASAILYMIYPSLSKAVGSINRHFFRGLFNLFLVLITAGFLFFGLMLLIGQQTRMAFSNLIQPYMGRTEEDRANVSVLLKILVCALLVVNYFCASWLQRLIGCLRERVHHEQHQKGDGGGKNRGATTDNSCSPCAQLQHQHQHQQERGGELRGIIKHGRTGAGGAGGRVTRSRTARRAAALGPGLLNNSNTNSQTPVTQTQSVMRSDLFPSMSFPEFSTKPSTLRSVPSGSCGGARALFRDVGTMVHFPDTAAAEFQQPHTISDRCTLHLSSHPSPLYTSFLAPTNTTTTSTTSSFLHSTPTRFRGRAAGIFGGNVSSSSGSSPLLQSNESNRPSGVASGGAGTIRAHYHARVNQSSTTSREKSFSPIADRDVKASVRHGEESDEGTAGQGQAVDSDPQSSGYSSSRFTTSSSSCSSSSSSSSSESSASDRSSFLSYLGLVKTGAGNESDKAADVAAAAKPHAAVVVESSFVVERSHRSPAAAAQDASVAFPPPTACSSRTEVPYPRTEQSNDVLGPRGCGYPSTMTAPAPQQSGLYTTNGQGSSTGHSSYYTNNFATMAQQPNNFYSNGQGLSVGHSSYYTNDSAMMAQQPNSFYSNGQGSSIGPSGCTYHSTLMAQPPGSLYTNGQGLITGTPISSPTAAQSPISFYTNGQGSITGIPNSTMTAQQPTSFYSTGHGSIIGTPHSVMTAQPLSGFYGSGQTSTTGTPTYTNDSAAMTGPAPGCTAAATATTPLLQRTVPRAHPHLQQQQQHGSQCSHAAADLCVISRTSSCQHHHHHHHSSCVTMTSRCGGCGSIGGRAPVAAPSSCGVPKKARARPVRRKRQLPPMPRMTRSGKIYGYG